MICGGGDSALDWTVALGQYEAAQETYKRLGMEEAGYLVLERCPLEDKR